MERIKWIDFLRAFSKVFIQQEVFNWQESIIQILSGRASWFIAALIVAEILFSILLQISHGKHRWLLPVALLCLITYYIIPFNQYNFWQ